MAVRLFDRRPPNLLLHRRSAGCIDVFPRRPLKRKPKGPRIHAPRTNRGDAAGSSLRCSHTRLSNYCVPWPYICIFTVPVIHTCTPYRTRRGVASIPGSLVPAEQSSGAYLGIIEDLGTAVFEVVALILCRQLLVSCILTPCVSVPAVTGSCALS
jgi:hypothetical protein